MATRRRVRTNSISEADTLQRSRERFGHVAAGSLLAGQEKEGADRLEVIRKQINALLTASADATPATDERGAAEEIRFDRHGVKACHVFSGVASLSI